MSTDTDYVEDIAERTHSCLVSMSDSIGLAIDKRTKVIVVWDLSVQALDAKTTRFTNHIEVRITPDYLEMLEKRGVTLEVAKFRNARSFNGRWRCLGLGLERQRSYVRFAPVGSSACKSPICTLQ